MTQVVHSSNGPQQLGETNEPTFWKEVRSDVIHGMSYGTGSAIGSFLGILAVGWMTLRLIGPERVQRLRGAHERMVEGR